MTDWLYVLAKSLWQSFGWLKEASGRRQWAIVGAKQGQKGWKKQEVQQWR